MLSRHLWPELVSRLIGSATHDLLIPSRQQAPDTCARAQARVRRWVTGAQTLQLDSHMVCNLGQLTAPLWATDFRVLALNPLCFSLHNLFSLLWPHFPLELLVIPSPPLSSPELWAQKSPRSRLFSHTFGLNLASCSDLFPLHFHPQSHCLPRHKPQASCSSIHLDISLTLSIWQVLSWVNFTTHVFSNANEAFLFHLLPPPTSTISPT